MGIDLDAARRHKQKLLDEVRELETVKAQIINYDNSINSYWSAEEMKYVNICIDNIINKIDDAKKVIENLGDAIESAANRIRQKEIEEERIRAAREAERIAQEALKKIQNMNNTKEEG